MGASCGRVASINRESVAVRNGTSSTSSSRPSRFAPVSSVATGGTAAVRVSGWGWTRGGASSPVFSARRSASWTRLILFLRKLYLGRVVEDDGSSHCHCRYQTRSGPSQPGDTPAPAHNKVVLQQRDTTQDGHLGVRPHILQVLERGVFHFARGGDDHPEQQPEPRANSDVHWALRFGRILRQRRCVQQLELFPLSTGFQVFGDFGLAQTRIEFHVFRFGHVALA